jgi:hypothetical protein
MQILAQPEQVQKPQFKYKHTSRSKGYRAKSKLSKSGLWYRTKRAQLVQERGGRCLWHTFAGGEPCTAIEQKELEFAHIKPTPLSNTIEGRGSWRRYRDIKDHPDCYLLLCQDHHKILDGRDGNL